MATPDWLVPVLTNWHQYPIAVLAAVLGIYGYLQLNPPRDDPWKGSDDVKAMTLERQIREDSIADVFNEIEKVERQIKDWVLEIRNDAVDHERLMREGEIAKANRDLILQFDEKVENAHNTMWTQDRVIHENIKLEVQNWTRDYVETHCRKNQH